MTHNPMSDDRWQAQAEHLPPPRFEETSPARPLFSGVSGLALVAPVLVAGLILIEMVIPAQWSPVGFVMERWGAAEARFENARREDEIITQVAEAKAESIKGAALAYSEIDKKQAEVALQTAVVKQAPEIVIGFADQLLCGLQNSYGPNGYGGDTDFCKGAFGGGRQRSTEALVREQADALEAASPRNAEAYIERAPRAREILAGDRK